MSLDKDRQEEIWTGYDVVNHEKYATLVCSMDIFSVVCKPFAVSKCLYADTSR